MPRFIKVTSHPEETPLFLRWDQVDFISTSADGITFLGLSLEHRTDHALVTETPEEVAKLIEEADTAEWGAPASWVKKQIQAREESGE